MKSWYEDRDCGIFFSDTPKVAIRYIIPDMTIGEKQSISKYPFINRESLTVTLFDNKKLKKYEFEVPKDYCWDGATIPRLFWDLIGPKTDNKFLIPSMIHDVLCENHHYVNNDRYFADKIFERLLYVSGVPAFKRWLMFHTVDNFQKFCGWGKKK